METTQLGTTDISVSKICLGTWAIGGWMWGGSDERECIRAIHHAFEQGVDFIDTAPVYGFGRSEEVVGKALAQWPGRANIKVATKVALQWDAQEKVVRSASRARIVAEVQDSLRRLGLRHIDLYQVHWPDPRVPQNETAEAMHGLLKSGTVRALGVSNYSPGDMAAFARVAPLAAVQSPYNLFEREIERDVLTHAQAHHISVLSYGAICRGLLSGKHHADAKFSGDDLRNRDPKFLPPRFATYLDAVEQLGALARQQYGKSVLALALRWVIDQGTIALWGARKPEQLDAVPDVLGWRLTGDDRADIDRILQQAVTDPVGPEFMAPPARAA